MLEILGGMATLAPPAYTYGSEKLMKTKNSTSWCSIFQWQKARNNARPPDSAELRWKSILSVLDASFSC